MLTAGEAESIYNTPQVPGLTTYNLGDMSQLFGLYNAETGSVTIGSLTWQYVTGLSLGVGQASTDGNGDYYVQLDALGDGVERCAGEPTQPRRRQRRRQSGH